MRTRGLSSRDAGIAPTAATSLAVTDRTVDELQPSVMLTQLQMLAVSDPLSSSLCHAYVRGHQRAALPVLQHRSAADACRAVQLDFDCGRSEVGPRRLRTVNCLRSALVSPGAWPSKRQSLLAPARRTAEGAGHDPTQVRQNRDHHLGGALARFAGQFTGQSVKAATAERPYGRMTNAVVRRRPRCGRRGITARLARIGPGLQPTTRTSPLGRRTHHRLAAVLQHLALRYDRTTTTITALARLAITLICARRLLKN